MRYKIDLPTCSCVQAARAMQDIFRIPAKYEWHGDAVGTSLYYVTVRCGYCKQVLSYKEGCEMVVAG